MDALTYALAVLLAYLLGSIPTGYLVARRSGNVDLLRQGSRRTGATNVLRTVGRRAAAIVFAGDFAKGAAAVAVARLVSQGDPLADALAGLAVVLGHNYSLYLRFRGGRGVVAGLGSLLVISPAAMLAAAALAFSVIAATRYVSLGSILGACSVPLLLLLLAVTLGQPLPHLAYGLLGSAFVIASHKDNIGRLLRGTERKLGERVGS